MRLLAWQMAKKSWKTLEAAKIVNCEVVMERFWVVLDERQLPVSTYSILIQK